MDLALNNLQRLICHKIQPTNQFMPLCTPISWSGLVKKTKTKLFCSKTKQNLIPLELLEPD